MLTRLALTLAALAAAALVAACGSDETQPAAKPAGKPATEKPSKERTESALPSEDQSNAALARFGAKHRPIYCGGRKKKWVALTFDDGPGPYTRKLLRIARRADIPVTFFVSGRNVATFKPALMAAKAYGAPIGNHSWSHPLLTTLSDRVQENQLKWTNSAVRRATGERVRFFRPPYGAHDRTTDRLARRMKMPIILWNVDSEDALGANSKKISRLVKKGFTPGSIILLHENRGQTLRAMKYSIVPALKKSGLTAVTVPQMLAGNPPTAKQLSQGRKGCR